MKYGRLKRSPILGLKIILHFLDPKATFKLRESWAFKKKDADISNPNCSLKISIGARIMFLCCVNTTYMDNFLSRHMRTIFIQTLADNF